MGLGWLCSHTYSVLLSTVWLGEWMPHGTGAPCPGATFRAPLCLADRRVEDAFLASGQGSRTEHNSCRPRGPGILCNFGLRTEFDLHSSVPEATGHREWHTHSESAEKEDRVEVWGQCQALSKTNVGNWGSEHWTPMAQGPEWDHLHPPPWAATPSSWLGFAYFIICSLKMAHFLT